MARYRKAPRACLTELASSSVPEHVPFWTFLLRGREGGTYSRSRVDCLQSEYVVSWGQSIRPKHGKTLRLPLGVIVKVASPKSEISLSVSLFMSYSEI